MVSLAPQADCAACVKALLDAGADDDIARDLRERAMSTRLTLALALVLTATAAWAQMPAPPAGTIEYDHVDALGSVRAVTDASGAVVRTHHYHPFGEGVGVETGTDPMRFTGKPRDGETGLDYFGARYYAQRTGRFNG